MMLISLHSSVRSRLLSILVAFTLAFISVFSNQATVELQYSGDISPKLINNHAKTIYMNRSLRDEKDDEPPSLANQATTFIASELLAILYPPSERRLSNNLRVLEAKCVDELTCELLDYVVSDKLRFDVWVIFTERPLPKVVAKPDLEPDADGFRPLNIGLMASIVIEVFAPSGDGEVALEKCVPIIGKSLQIENHQANIVEKRRKRDHDLNMEVEKSISDEL